MTNWRNRRKKGQEMWILYKGNVVLYTYPVCDEYTFCSHLFPEKAMCLLFITTTWSPQSPAKMFRVWLKNMIKETLLYQQQ